MPLQSLPVFNYSLISRLLFSFVVLFGLIACGGGGGGLTVSISAASTAEGNSGSTNLFFAVILSSSSTSDVTVDYATSNGTAVAGEDYTATSGTLTIPANSTSANIEVEILGDTDVEDTETFTVTINNARSASIPNGSMSVNGSIIADDILTGYFDGNLSVNQGSSTLSGNIHAILDAGRLIVTDLTNNLAYVIENSNLIGSSITTRIFYEGNFVRNTSADTTVAASGDLTITLSGSGDYTTGTVSLNYNTKNAEAAFVMTNGDVWTNAAGGIGAVSNTVIDYSFNTNVLSTELEGCQTTGVTVENVVTEQTGRVRSFTSSPSTCLATTANGYFTPLDVMATDDIMYFILYNDDGIHADLLLP